MRQICCHDQKLHALSKSFIQINLTYLPTFVYYIYLCIYNIYKGIDSSGASIFLKKSSESDYSGTILICEGGCDKFPANATLRKNILTLQYRTNWEQNGKINYESHSEKLDLSELWDDGRVHAEDNGKSPEGLLYDCRIAKKGVDGDRMVASTYCYNHADFQLNR